MLDAKDFFNNIKQIAIDANETTKPVNILFGKVTNILPLKINVEQKMVLSNAQLILTRNVTDYNVTMDIDFNTESVVLNANHTHDATVDVNVTSSLSPNDNNATITNQTNSNISIENKNINLSHTHKVKGTKTFVVHNGLVVGDEVVLLRFQGGQKYLVLDRVKV